jgi:tight adherence protein B
MTPAAGPVRRTHRPGPRRRGDRVAPAHAPPKPERVPSSLERRLTALSPRTRVTLARLRGCRRAARSDHRVDCGVVILPAAALGLPYLLSAPPAAARIRRVEAMEEWTRSLAGVWAPASGIEQALTATLRSTPDPIKPEVTALVARLRARWDTETALRRSPTTWTTSPGTSSQPT